MEVICAVPSHVKCFVALLNSALTSAFGLNSYKPYIQILLA